MTDRNLRDIASRCEAKLHGFRRTADGVVVSFVVSPIDVPPALALDPLGTRYMLAFCAIGDDETPIPDRSSPTSSSPREDEEFAAAVKRAKAGVVRLPCDDIIGSPETLTPKARYAAMTAGEQAVQRAGILANDLRFQAWAGTMQPRNGAPLFDAPTWAASYIRDRCCDGNSRKMIAEAPEYMDRFQQMLTEFMIAVGELPEPR